ncbi:beta-lactamase family protein [Pseudoflavonifractor phocaeensis]|uniref:serine hydrolase domain-containing protein n=1 Tax=Pseudoflavonifractor phocaeensis TaxID=1870988 RepID=UPI0019579F27|nr:serine hydrolase domain-containing protein [Pseudoflavonifractor phocaeensis]MBM6870216.1 beta-lactamase family protein [Pseudoflavonifractor phocaeensis]MBM6938134.1 beta-lactamase family protein [Pseudoflavonifractor phocaeensis]
MNGKRICALALAGVLTLSAFSPAALAAGDTRAESAQAAITQAMTYGGATSIQYALWEDGEITMTGHAGTFSRTENRALTDDTLYGIGSVSKIYTTAALLSLAEEGKVELDAPVTRYLTDFTMADPRYTDITVEMLLDHSSGLMGDSTRSAFLFGDADPAATDTLLERLSTQRLKANPGAYSVYCNDGFTLAELVVEAVTGQTFTDYVRTALLTPAGLDDTFTSADAFDTDRLARIYLDGDTRALPVDTLNIIGAGGFYATASDLAAFGGSLCAPGLLDQDSLDAMAVDHAVEGLWPADSEDDLLAFGLGWDSVHMFPFNQNGITALVKGGDSLYYHAGLIVLPEYDMAVAVLSSGGLSTYNQLAGAQILMDALAEDGITVTADTALPDAQPAALPASELEKAGTYAGLGSVMTVAFAGNEMVLTPAAILGGEAQRLTYYSDGSYRDASNSVMVKLVEETDGQTYFYQKGYSTLPGLPPVCQAQYVLQKMEENPLSQADAQVWAGRSSMLYLPLNEKYTSELYANATSLFSSVPVLAECPGYATLYRITDANHAVQYLTIPGNGSRNGADLTFTTQNGVEYLEMNGYLCMALTGVSSIYTGAGAACSIQTDGYARWFQVGSAAGQTLALTVTGKGGCYVYNADGSLAASTYLFGDTSVTLPENGWIVFAGEVGARLQLQRQ